MAEWGLDPADFPESDDGVEVFPENVTATNAFIAMGTQWRTSGYGAVGLDYTAIPTVLRLQGVARAEWPDTFECIRLMEGEAMRVMNEKRA